MKRIAIPFLLSASVALGYVGTNANCIVCLNSFRARYPSHLTPTAIRLCIQGAIANCNSCNAAFIVAQCNRPMEPQPRSFWDCIW